MREILGCNVRFRVFAVDGDIYSVEVIWPSLWMGFKKGFRLDDIGGGAIGGPEGGGAPFSEPRQGGGRGLW